MTVEKLWWDLWIATWHVLAWMEAWSESEAKRQCLRLHGPACDLKGHWFAPWTTITASTAVFGGDGPGQPSGNTEHAAQLRYVGQGRGGYEMVGCSCGVRCDSDGWVAHAASVLRR